MYHPLTIIRYLLEVACEGATKSETSSLEIGGYADAPLYWTLCLFLTDWFYLLCALVAIFVAWLFYRWHTRHLACRRNIIFAAQLSERERITRVLHDSWLQNIHGLVLSLANIVRLLPEGSAVGDQLNRLLVRADQVIQEGREEIMGLRTFISRTSELAGSFEVLGARLRQEFGTAFVVRVEGVLRQMDRRVLNEIYYIGSEALYNAFRHAEASLITLTLDFRNDIVSMSIVDDGVGMPEQVLKSRAREGRWGLVSMHERTAIVGGELVLRSDSSGTEICFNILPQKRRNAWLRKCRLLR